MALQLRRGTDAERTAGGGVIFAEGELVYVTDTEEVYVGDGITPGGIRVTGNVSGSPAQLTQNLSLNGYNITGTGNININGTITASNINGGGSGVVEGQEYIIDIQGDVRGSDSSIIVDSVNGIVYADFIGDGSLLTGITVSSLEDTDIVSPLTGQILSYNGTKWINSDAPGLTEGNTYNIDITGSIVGLDSTTIVDSATRTATLSTIKPTVNYNLFTIDSGTYEMRLEAQSNKNLVKLYSTNDAGSLSSYTDFYGVIDFGKRDSTVNRADATIKASVADMRLSHDTVSALIDDETKHFTLKNGNFGFGTYTPGAKLDVRGTGAFTGDVTLSSASLKLSDLRAYTDITSPVVGEVMYDNVQSTLLFRSSSGWNKVIYSEVNTLLTQVPGPIVIGGVTSGDLAAADDSAISGLIAYDTDNDRMTFYQAGSFVRLPNNGSTIGEVLKWNGTEWASAPESGGVAPGSNADFLDGFDGTYYLDYSNFTNTPTFATVATTGAYSDLSGTPTISAFGVTLIDDADAATARTTLGLGTAATTASADYATAAQGATADSALQPADLGSFTFTGSVLDTSDSSGITVTPAVTVSSDLTVENDLRVTNSVYADRFVSTNVGTPAIEAATNLDLTAGNAVRVTSSVLRLASFTTAERDTLAAQNGDLIYNTTLNKFQGYENGAWVNLI